MFSNLVLPFQITVVMLAVMVLLVTALAPRMKWKRRSALVGSLGLALIAFIPSILVADSVVNWFRFGEFHHAAYADVQDSRVEWFLPPMAKEITLHTTDGGHCAKYLISEADLAAYIDGVWEKYGHHSSTPKSKSRYGERVESGSFDVSLKEKGWSISEDSVVYESPYAANGAGATYYYDRSNGTAYHRGGYW